MGQLNWHSLCGRAGPSCLMLLSTGFKFPVFTVLYQLFLERPLILRKFYLLRGFALVVTRRQIAFNTGVNFQLGRTASVQFSSSSQILRFFGISSK